MQAAPAQRPLRRVVISGLAMLSAALSIAVGIALWEDRRYGVVSVLLLLAAMTPFFLLFEQRKPRARELVVLSVLCAIAVAGRGAFFMLPQFKPVAAVVIVAGVALGAESGFLVGAASGFISNFFFGQGPWTPWQMLCFGLIGFFAGVLFQVGRLPKKRGLLCLYGGLSTLILYGGIVNIGALLIWSPQPSAKLLLATYLSGLPFDCIHAAATVFFLYTIGVPMLEKLERVKKKYGLLHNGS